MNHSGDAAEQIVRLCLEGVEVAAKITGTAAKEVAAFLIAALKNKDSKLKTKGRARLNAMLKSGKALDFFAVKQSDLKKFAEGAKQYGIVYCVMRHTKNDPNAMCDIMVKAEDAPKINRVVETFKFATVDKARIESEIIQSKAERTQGAKPAAGAEQAVPDKNDTEKLLDDLLGNDEGKATPEAEKGGGKEAQTQKNPEAAKTAKARPSEPTSTHRSKSAGGTSSEKPSVKEEIREIKATRAGLAAQAKKEADTPTQDGRQTLDNPKNKSTAGNHKQPTNNSKPKSKKSKER